MCLVCMINWMPYKHTHKHARCGHANTQQPPCGWHDEALGVDVMTPRQARNNVMKNSVMWLGTFQQGTGMEQ